MPNSTVGLVHIFFDTASFDEIERDKKIEFEAQLSLIAGTMGLLTEFSIISSVEILYFVVKSLFIMVKVKINTYLTSSTQTHFCRTGRRAQPHYSVTKILATQVL